MPRKQSEPIVGQDTKKRRPLAYKRAVRALADGKSIKTVAAQENLAESNVARIRKDCSEFIQEESKKATLKLIGLRGKLLDAATTALEHVDLGDVKARDVKDLSVALGVVQDKTMAVTDGRVSRVEHVHVSLPETVSAGAIIDILPPAKTCKNIEEDDQTPVNTDMAGGSGNRHSDQDQADDGGEGVDQVGSAKV